MALLKAEFTPAFKRDLKKLDKRHVDDAPLADVIDLIIESTTESFEKLHN
ncbi:MULTISPECIES: type II toxin-antitoxin system YafQ family toxin [Eggerthella]|jgi:mRNA interferase YafQ|nr:MULTISPECIES: type II toxin-antitoxin system YafQ family toxin [Eggerthella]MBS6969600.1 hypothetical protein [Eggerthella sp.]MDB1740009.1 hypothetical protein [Eggerthella lenta]MDB1742559.1 hypothetical protein [Eggerthella lenta]MDB1774948.1 hypothetical protein [Eggerthella lenta]MDB1783397.1 hypothetical protein [Eggerthella lenta]